MSPATDASNGKDDPSPMALQIRIDRDACMGSGNCAFLAPATFDVDDDMKAVVLAEAHDDDERIALAARECPTGAIRVTRDGHPLAGPRA